MKMQLKDPRKDRNAKLHPAVTLHKSKLPVIIHPLCTLIHYGVNT